MTTATTPDTDPGTSTPPQTTTPPAPWYGSAPADVQAWMENRGLKAEALTPELALKAINGHYNAERYIGTPADKLIRLPADEDEKSWGDVYAKLGRPESPEKYTLPTPDGADPEFVKTAATWFHAAGLNTKQAAKVAEQWNAHVAEVVKAEDEARQAALTAEAQTLDKEWGAAKERNMAVAKAAATKFGVPAETIDKLEQVMGYATVMKFFHAVGAATGQDKFEQGEGSRPGFQPMGPEQARARIAELQRDQNWVTRYVRGGREELAEMNRLQQIAAAR